MSRYSYFHNADITVTRSEGSRGASGYSESSTQTILNKRCDFQEMGHMLDEEQAGYEKGEGIAFVDGAEAAEPGDEATIETDDGRTIEGSVAGVNATDSSLRITRS